MSTELPVTTIGRYRGKACKTDLLRGIIKMELAKGEPLDRQRVLLIARKKLEQYPREQREGVTIDLPDVSKAYTAVRDGKKKESTSQPAAPSSLPMTPQAPSYTGQDLLNAKRFLGECGHSLVKARSLLDLVSTLLQGE